MPILKNSIGCLRVGRLEEEVERVARYLNGLRQGIQDEISMMALDSMHKCFQLALRVEDKARRKNGSYQRGRGNNRGFRGNFGRGLIPNKIDEA